MQQRFLEMLRQLFPHYDVLIVEKQFLKIIKSKNEGKNGTLRISMPKDFKINICRSKQPIEFKIDQNSDLNLIFDLNSSSLIIITDIETNDV